MKTPAVFWLSSLCLMTVLSADSEISLASKKHSKQKDVCGRAPQHMRVSLRYDSPKGIGYNEGYTTLEGFFSPPKLLGDAWLPFVDVRGHLFDNGKWAANGGLGLRYLSSSRVWGFNGYYDYRNTTRQRYNQVGVGLETLGTVWDFRLNGYLPLGKTHTSLFRTHFKEFKDHFMLLSSTRQFAMKGLNAEAGYHLDYFKNAPLYFAAGPYYLTGKGASTWGGELRGRVDLFHRHVRLEAKTAYDNFFKWTGQGEVSVNVSFGGKSQVKKRGKNSCSGCTGEMTLAHRVVQPVDRAEIIPVGRKHITTTAINPATGQPFFFIFVNNTSHSLGTFESPYPNFDLVESASTVGSIIYVFPGDGSAYDTSTEGTLVAGLTLQDSQLLLGAATSQFFTTTMGAITVPPQAPTGSLPLLSTTFSNGTVVTLGNNNTISGLYFAGLGGTGTIVGTNIANFTSTQNTIAGTSSLPGIFLSGVTGDVVISNTTFSINSNSIGLASSTLNTLNVLGCVFGGDGNGSNGIFLDSGSSAGVMNISDTSFFRGNGNGIQLQGSIGALNISGSSFFQTGDNGVEVDGAVGSLTIANTTFLKCGGDGFLVQNSGSVGQVSVTECTFLNSNNYGINISGAIGTLDISDTSCSNNQSSGIIFEQATVGAVNIAGSYFSDNGGSTEFDIQNGSVVGNITITGSSFNNSTSDFGLSLGSGTTVNALTISDSNFNANRDGGITLNGILTTSLSISGCTFSGNTSVGIIFAPTNTLDSFSVVGSSFIGNTADGIEVRSSASVTNMTVSGCTFNSNNQNGLEVASGAVVGNLTVSGCTFSNHEQNSIAFDGGSTVTTFNIFDNSFGYSNNNAFQADLSNSTSGAISNNSFIYNGGGILISNTSNLVVQGNTFETNYVNNFVGYAAAINLTSAGPICLQFVNNYSSPPMTVGPTPAYSWNNSGGGVFNVTADSTQANNYGLIQQMNISGTCQ